MFVITGATGNTGSIAAKALLSAGKKVRAVVRSADKAKALADLGAEIFVADLTDQAALGRAVEGAEGVFLISPPDLAATNFIADRKALTGKQVQTLNSAKVPHVVVLSSIGAQHAEGTGPIRTTYNIEQQVIAAGLPATFVRAAFFVENWGAVLHPVKQDGVLPSFIRANQAIPMSSAPDIGKALANALLEGPQGTKIVELSGPVDVSPNDVAATFAGADHHVFRHLSEHRRAVPRDVRGHRERQGGACLRPQRVRHHLARDHAARARRLSVLTCTSE